jgi:hypothetical protein
MQSMKQVFCKDCVSWVGRCLKGRINKIAADDACEELERKKNRRSFVVGFIKLNKSKRSFKVQLESGYNSGIVSRKELILLLEGKLSQVDIIVFKSFYCLRQYERSLEIKAANPEQLQQTSMETQGSA